MGRKWNLTGWLRTERTWWVPFKPAMSVWYRTWHLNVQKTPFHTLSSSSTRNKLWWNNKQAFYFVPCSTLSSSACGWVTGCWQPLTSGSDCSRAWVSSDLMVTPRQRSLSVILKCHVASDGWHSHAWLMTHSLGHSRLAQGSGNPGWWLKLHTFLSLQGCILECVEW